MADPIFSQVVITEIPKKTTVPGTVTLTVPATKFWKIESVAIGGTNGTVYLRKSGEIVGILFTSISHDHFAARLPFWLPESYSIELVNDSSERAIVSISEWDN